MLEPSAPTHGPVGVGAPRAPDTGDSYTSDEAQNGMPRRLTGHLAQLKSGEWRVRFPWDGNPGYVHRFGPESKDWDRERLERERDYVIERVRRGEYTPPVSAPQPHRAAPRETGAPTFAVVAANYMQRYALRHPNAKTVDSERRALEWTLPTLGDVPVDEVDVALTDRYVTAKLQERADVQAAGAAGHPLMVTQTDTRLGSYQRRQRALNNASINKGLFAAKRVLVYARDRGHLGDADVPPLQRSKLEEAPPNRSFLSPVQIEYLLRAAGQLEAEARGLTPADVRYVKASEHSHMRLARELGVSDTTIRKVRRGEILARRRNDVARVAPITLYVLAGPRVSEGCDLDGVHVDLAGGRVHVPGTKTSAGDRWVPLLPAARERLIAHKLDFPFGPRDPVFATRNDRRNTPNNVTKTILNPAVERANALLEADGREPIAALTMHSLRRTFATILAICEVTQFRAKYLVGHEDYELTAKVYQQHIEVSDEDLDALERVMGCTIEEAYETFGGALRRRSRRRVSASNLHPDEKPAPEASERSGRAA